MARRAAKADEDAAQPVWGRPSGLSRWTAVHEQPRKTVRSARNSVVGQTFGSAAGLPPGAELYVSR